MGQSTSSPPPVADYSLDENWAWKPNFKDQSKKDDWNPHLQLPTESIELNTSGEAKSTSPYIESADEDGGGCDVFYIHPTTHLTPIPFKTNQTMKEGEFRSRKLI